LLTVLPHDRCGRFKPNADAAALVDISALGGNSTDDILGGQCRCHVAATLISRLPSHAIVGVNSFSTASLQFTRVIPAFSISVSLPPAVPVLPVKRSCRTTTQWMEWKLRD
jgi:hypothetical protein